VTGLPVAAHNKLTSRKNEQRALGRKGCLNGLELVVPELFMVEVALEGTQQLLVRNICPFHSSDCDAVLLLVYSGEQSHLSDSSCLLQHSNGQQACRVLQSLTQRCANTNVLRTMLW
jgi:hypothetical protein